MNEVKFTHTTYNTDVYVFAEQVVSVMTLPTMKSTVLVGPGSTVIPITDSVEEAIKKLKLAAKPAAQPKEKTNGVSKRKPKVRR